METFTDDTVVALASFLSPHDMICLALTCKRFGSKHGIDKKRLAAREESSTREVRQRTEISLMEVAARTVLFALATDEETNALPSRGEESWIGIYKEFLQLFRLPLQFDKLVGACVDHVDSTDKTKVYAMGSIHSSAICSNIMRAGRHSVSFNVNNSTGRSGVTCGIMRPTTNAITTLERCYPTNQDLSRFSLKDYEMLHSNNVDCCLLNPYVGNGLIRKRWKGWRERELMAMDDDHRLQSLRQQHGITSFNWEGMEETEEVSFKIGLELNLDEGTLDVYKNDRFLGTMISGLVGEYCWVVPLFNEACPELIEVSVSIGR